MSAFMPVISTLVGVVIGSLIVQYLMNKHYK